jgi:hypothetical protein
LIRRRYGDGRGAEGRGGDRQGAIGAASFAEKKQREGLSLPSATAFQVRSVNLNELAAVLPREAERLDMRYQWISRVLGNELIRIDEVMAPFAREVLERSGADGRTIVVMIDQVNDAHQMVTVSLRVGERALPLAWRMKKTHDRLHSKCRLKRATA